MIDESIGKILGMAMAYGVSSMGMLLAYVNYRKRIVKAEKVMSGTAWVVIAVTILALGAGALVVAQIAQPVAETPAAEAAVAEAAPAPPPPPAVSAPVADAEGSAWPVIGIVLPAIIFLSATWLTMALHRHFSRGAEH